MGGRRRAERAADREAAARSGWAVVGPHDVLPLAWTRARAGTPHRWGDPVHRVLAAFCAPGHAVALLAPLGWFHRDDRTVVLRLRPFRRPPWWPALVAFLVYQVVGRILGEVVGPSALPWVAGVLWYAVLVGVLAHLRSRELTTPQERKGWWRVPGDVRADWVLGGLAVAPGRADDRTTERAADGADDHVVDHAHGLAAVMPDVVRLVDARTPAGAVVLAWSPSERRDAELAVGGFTTVGRQRGHLVRTSAGTGVAEGADRPGTGRPTGPGDAASAP